MNLQKFDFHNHILPGVDDGFRTPEESLRAIRTLASKGCRQLVFTPHMNPDVDAAVSEQKMRDAYDAFVPMIPEELGVQTSLAAEYMVVRNFEQRADHPEELLTYPDKSILIEMSYYFRSENLEAAVFALNIAGLKPVLAHPERYIYMADSLKDFDKLHEMGCRFQLNYMSLSGIYGPGSTEILKYLLKKGWYDFICTDLHTNHQLESILSIKPDCRMRRRLGKNFPELEL